jgi:hypothetical protein
MNKKFSFFENLFKTFSLRCCASLLFFFITLPLIQPFTLLADSLPVPRGIAGDLWADIILGQISFGNEQFNQATTQTGFNLGGTVVDTKNGILYVWDADNNRILGLSINNLSTDTGQNQNYGSTILLGQPDYAHTGCNHDSNWQNFPTPPGTDGSCLCGLIYWGQTPAESDSIANMAVDPQGNLYVPDY